MRRPTLAEALAILGWTGAATVFIVGQAEPEFGSSVTAARSFTALITLGATLTIGCMLRRSAHFPISIEIAYRLGFQAGRRSIPPGGSMKE